MKNEREINYMFIDYGKINELSHRIDCTVTEADFNTNHPNPYRINYAAEDIHRFLINTKGEYLCH